MRGNGEEPRSEIGSMREYMSIYHYDILKSGLGAVPSGVYRVRICINVPCVALEQRQEAGFQNRTVVDGGSRAGE